MLQSRFFFIESKSFELSVYGRGEFLVRIYERGRDSVRSVSMGTLSAKRLVANLKDFSSKNHHGNFMCMTR